MFQINEVIFKKNNTLYCYSKRVIHSKGSKSHLSEYIFYKQ
jgi:hypothetical protein